MNSHDYDYLMNGFYVCDSCKICGELIECDSENGICEYCLED